MTVTELQEAIQRFYGDTSRTRAETKEALEDILANIETLIESLDD